MRILTLTLALAAALIIHNASADDSDLMNQANALFKPIPASPPPLKDNPLNKAKIELGRMLYFEPRLSASQAISCNTCHNMGLATVDGRETSIGHRWQHGPRNAPPVVNAVFNTAQFWDGRASDLEAQAGGPVENPIEMGATEDTVVATLRSIPDYRKRFTEAFPDVKEPVTFEDTRKAIAAFEATLLTPDAPFDRFLRGDAGALTATQKAGLKLFIETGCASCHNGINIGGNGYRKFGVVEQPGGDLLPPEDKGRFKVTQTVSDEYVFKVPSLRNVALTAPYFHSGRAWSLKQAVSVMGSSQLGRNLSDQEVDSIVAFLDSLTGKQPQVSYPVLPPRSGSTPLPSD